MHLKAEVQSTTQAGELPEVNDILSCEEWRWVPFLKMMHPKLSPSQDSMEWAAAASLSLSAKGSYKALCRRKTFAGEMPGLRLVHISDQLIGYSWGSDRSADLATGTHSCNRSPPTFPLSLTLKQFPTTAQYQTLAFHLEPFQ